MATTARDRLPLTESEEEKVRKKKQKHSGPADYSADKPQSPKEIKATDLPPQK